MTFMNEAGSNRLGLSTSTVPDSLLSVGEEGLHSGVIATSIISFFPPCAWKCLELNWPVCKNNTSTQLVVERESQHSYSVSTCTLLLDPLPLLFDLEDIFLLFARMDEGLTRLFNELMRVVTGEETIQPWWSFLISFALSGILFMATPILVCDNLKTNMQSLHE